MLKWSYISHRTIVNFKYDSVFKTQYLVNMLIRLANETVKIWETGY